MANQPLSVALPLGTLYVSGTVNGVSTNWTQQENSTWQTIAPRAADDIYQVSLTIISSSGQSTSSSFTLYYGLLQLITDRTQTDVEYAQQLNAIGWANMSSGQRSEYLGGLKGAYNATDLNRVGSAVNYVAQRLTDAGYQVLVAPKINWSVSDIPTQSDMTAYLADVQTMRDVFPMPSTTPELPADMAGLTYQEANNIEQILLDVDALITAMANAWYYSGEIQCGEV